MVVDDEGRVFAVNQLFPPPPPPPIDERLDVSVLARKASPEPAFEEAVWVPTHRVHWKSGPRGVSSEHRIWKVHVGEKSEDKLWAQLPQDTFLFGDEGLDLLSWLRNYFS